MQDKILLAVNDGIRAMETLKKQDGLAFIQDAAEMIANCFKRKNKIIIAGNGGSLCDGIHFAEELTGFFRDKRKALPAIALSCPGHLTCVGNDAGYDYVFSRGVEALGCDGDIFIALTTSGNSPNLLHATDVAKKNGLHTISFLGKKGGKLKGVADLEWIVDGFSTSDRVQEAHMAAIHIIIEMLENILHKDKFFV